ncbi:MAG: hypothetical protein O2820_02075 [Planctomycetota bacterium]|nr:hypothetical protein [Planctomycetota bacterium]MDA1247986.1 hypothetical protein [Planctomycetota bacterium]
MNNTLRFPLLGIVLIVGLRMAIGWQLLYEGLWKIDTLDSPRPWTAEGYLKNSQGPARSFFREMTGDPSDFGWLDHDKVAGRWDVWHKHFVAHYKLDEAQQKKLEEIVNGFEDFRAELKELPGDWTEEKFNKQLESVKFVAKSKRLIVDGKQRITPREKAKLLSLGKGDDDKSKAYRKAVEQVYQRATRDLSAKERLLASLYGDPSRAGLIVRDKDGEVDEKRLGDIDLFKQASARYESRLAGARQDYNYKHLDYDFQELQTLKSKAIGPIKALENELMVKAAELLTEKQLTMPPVSLPWTRMDWINFQTIAGLTALGFLLMGGLFTRTAAVLAAGMLFMFYLAMPPLPGLPPAPGPEHSYLVNKNLIEVLALLTIAAFPTGQWFGLDSVITWLRGGSADSGETTDAASTAAAGSATDGATTCSTTEPKVYGEMADSDEVETAPGAG